MKPESATETESLPPACDVLYTLACDIVLENVRCCLRHSLYPELQKVSCDFYEGMLTMNGVVSRFFLKQLAHSLAAGVEGVEEIASHIEVRYPSTVMRDHEN